MAGPNISGTKVIPLGHPAYNHRDIQADGFIFPTLFKANPDNPSITDKIKQLPASSMFIEIKYRTTNSSNSATLGSLSSGGAVAPLALLGAGAGAIGAAIISSTVLGGTSYSKTDFVIHVCDSEFRINMPLTVGDNDEIELSGYPISVFAVTKQKLTFTASQLANIGDFDRGAYGGITGPVLNEGKFMGTLRKRFSTVTHGQAPAQESDDIFVEIIRDTRRFAFRADNMNTSPYAFVSDSKKDLIDKKIRIKTDGLTAGNTVYFTGTIATKKHNRIAIQGRGTTFTGGNILGSIAFSPTATLGEGNAWSYTPCTFAVPKTVTATNPKTSVADIDDTEKNDNIEGWRISEVYSEKSLRAFWALDRRGILIVRDSNVTIIASTVSLNLNNQQWFTDYLAEHDLENADKDFSQAGGEVEINRTGVLFDISRHVNSLLYDREKIPYHRDFALALSKIKDEDLLIGIPNLDLVNQHPIVAGVDIYDLTSAVFAPAKTSSVFGSTYRPVPIQGNLDSVIYDPEDIQVRISIIPVAMSDSQSVDWLIRTPSFSGLFNKNTRLYCERYATDAGMGGAKRFSFLFAKTNASALGNISIETDSTRNNTYVAFSEQSSGRLAYHVFTSNNFKYQLSKVSPEPTAVHSLPEFSHNGSLILGSDRLFGDSPSYSKGRIITTEFGNHCTDGTIFWKQEQLTFTGGNDSPLVINLDNTHYYQNITINYEFNLNQVNNLRGDIGTTSFDFGEGYQICNIFATIGVGTYNLSVDTANYNGSTINVGGLSLTNAKINSVVGTYIEEEDFAYYSVVAQQVSIAIDGRNRFFIFYTNDETDNIDAVMSTDGGKRWMRFRGLIRLIEGEKVSTPLVISDKNLLLFHLFYTLNDTFILVKDIHSSLFFCDDVDINYVPILTLDGVMEDNEGLMMFSDQGKALRKQTSYFVVADSSDTFYQKEISIANTRRSTNKVARFFGTSISMTHNISASDYAVFIDPQGRYRILYVIDGNLYWKTSSTFSNWNLDVENFVFHKDLDSSTENSIASIQAIPAIEQSLVYTLYTHDNMLFMRTFDSLFLLPDSSGNTNLANYLDLDEDNKKSLPLYIVGSMDDDLRIAIETSDPELWIKNPYPISRLFDFNDLDNIWGIDSNIKPNGYISPDGNFRLFYMSGSKNIESILMTVNNNNEFIPIFDFQHKASNG